jgi:hypothetical protein
MTRLILTAALLLISSPVARAQVAPAAVQEYLDANRPHGSGPGIIIARVDGKLTEYGQHLDTAILYSYQIGESRDRSHAQYLVVFKSAGEEYFPTKPRLVGISGFQILNEISIDLKTMTLRGSAWGPKDGGCCPSEAIFVLYVVVDDELVAKGAKISQFPAAYGAAIVPLD